MRDDRPDQLDQPDRRSEPGLRFDPADRRLALGTADVVVPAGTGNRGVLAAYVALAARCRGDRVADLIELRQDDLDALALALDLDAADLAEQVQEILGATGDQAVRFITRLRENRLVGGAAKVAAGALLAGSLLAGAGAVAAAARAETGPATAVTADAGGPATTTTTDATAAGGWVGEDEPVIDGPLTTTPDGVGLIPPVTEDAGGVVLIPPASVDAGQQAGS